MNLEKKIERWRVRRRGVREWEGKRWGSNETPEGATSGIGVAPWSRFPWVCK